MAGEPTEKPFPNPKNLGGEISKNMQRVFLTGRSGQACPLGGGAWFRLFLGNRFELWSIIEPRKNTV